MKILELLKSRNEIQNVDWEKVQTAITNEQVEQSVLWMEETGGEPTVVYFSEMDEWAIVDLSTETPKGRRSVCYDEQARLSRKKFPPELSVEGICSQLNVQLVDEARYRYLQEMKPVDLKTSSWIYTPSEIRELGGALFGDCRYKKTFIYHNGADSYYASRGFRVYIPI